MGKTSAEKAKERRESRKATRKWLKERRELRK